MATVAQIVQVRLNIDDLDSEDFSNAIITIYIDEHSSVSWASWKLLEILKVRLRKQLLKKDTTGAESTELHSLKEQLELYDDLIEKYKDEYKTEKGTSTGRYISTVKPTVAGDET